MYWLTYLFFLTPLVLIGLPLALLGLYSFTGNSVIDLFSILLNRGAKLTCWHCGQETLADRRTCQHCQQELQ